MTAAWIALGLLVSGQADLPEEPLPPGAVKRFGTRRFRIDQGVGALALSPDGKTLAVNAGNSNTLLFFALPDGLELGRHRFESDGGGFSFVRPVAFSPDGKLLASASWGNSVRLVEAAARREKARLFSHEGEVLALAFSPDGKVLASAGDDGKVILRVLETGKETSLEAGGRIAALAFSGDGTRLLSAGTAGEMRAWDAATGRERAPAGERREVHVARFSPDGSVLALGDLSGRVRLVNPADGRLLREIEAHSGGVATVAFLGNGKVLLSAGIWEAVRLWDAATGEKLLETPDDELFGAAAVAADGMTMVTASGHALFVWRFEEGPKPALKLLTRQPGHLGQVQSVSFSADGRRLATAADHYVRIWDVETAREVRVLQGSERNYQSVAFSPAGRTVAAGSINTPVRLWDADTGKELSKIEELGSSVMKVAFSPTGKALAVAGAGGEIVLADPATGKNLRTLRGHTMRAEAIAFTPGGETLVSAGRDKTIRLWDVRDGAPVLKIDRAEGWEDALDVSPDGKTFASGGWEGDGMSGIGDHTVRVWETATGKVLFAVEAHGKPYAVAFSPDGRLLAAASSHTVELWNARSGRPRGRFDGHGGSVASLAFTPDGRRLASGSHDTTVLLWDLSALKEEEKPEGPAPGEKELAAAWEALAGPTGPGVQKALAALRAAGDRAAALASKGLQPTPPGPEETERLLRRLSDLNHDDPGARDEAARELSGRVGSAYTVLAKARNEARSSEIRARLDDLLKPWDLAGPLEPGAPLRAWRAIQLLESLGSPAAREALESLTAASLPPGVRREAGAALRRLAQSAGK